VLVPHAAGFSTTIEVTGDGTPLAGAEVYIFGSVWPTQGVTDANGRCAISILGESPDTIRAVYVKPKLDYWSFWMPRPELVPNGIVSIECKALGSYLAEFPDRQLIGWGGIAMGLDQVPATMNGAGVKIAIIDSGAAQQTHRNLHQTGPGLSVVGPDAGAWTDDTIGHGSHCAGIIAGGPTGPNGSGVRGFAPGAEIHICRIFPGGRFSDLVGALDYCMENGVDVVNMSLGGGEPSQIIEERLIRAKQMGIACIVAAGNSGGPVQFPASTPHALAVAAIGKWGEFPDDSYHSQQALGGATSGTGYFPASFSCFGPEIDVCAPGVAIVSSLPPDGFAAWDGTSMATPHVTGLAALVLAHHPDFKDAFRARDSRRVERLFQIIKESSTPLSVGGPERQGAGLPSAPRALGLLAQPAAATGAGTGAMPTDASIEALRKLLALMSGQRDSSEMSPQPQAVQPLVGSPAGEGSAFQPASVTGAWRAGGGETWSNPPASRGPASIDLASMWPWLQAFGRPASPIPEAQVDAEAFRRAMKRGGISF
jgi:subtilisin family serine protease